MWSQYLDISTLASSPGPAMPRAIVRLGAAAWKVASQATQASLDRTCRIDTRPRREKPLSLTSEEARHDHAGHLALRDTIVSAILPM